MSLNYSEDKQKLFLDYDIEKLKDFVKSLPQAQLTKILNELPKVNGFRPGKEIELKLNNYFKKISHWNDKDWKIMYDFWLIWTKSSLVFQIAFKAFKTKQELENELMSLQEPEKLKEIIVKLIQLCISESVSQDTLKNWLDFSPYLPSPEIETLLDLAPSQTDISLKSKFNSYELRLKNSDSELQKMTQQLKLVQESNAKQSNKYNQEISEIKSNLSSISLQINDNTKAHEQYARQIEQLKKSTESKIKETSLLINQIQSVSKRNEKKITQIEGNLEDITVKRACSKSS